MTVLGLAAQDGAAIGVASISNDPPHRTGRSSVAMRGRDTLANIAACPQT